MSRPPLVTRVPRVQHYSIHTSTRCFSQWVNNRYDPFPPINIVFFMADDFGHYNVGFHGNKEARTPALDALVQEGVQLEWHYVYKYCSPTRSSFLSGRLPIHVNTANRHIDDAGGVDIRMATVADKLRAVGYQTHQVGKWHAGSSAEGCLPYRRGFMSSFGYLGGMTDHYTQGGPGHIDFWDTAGPAYGHNGSKCADGTGSTRTCFSPLYNAIQFNNRSLSIIAAHDPATSLFLYHAWQETHFPNQVPSLFINDAIDYELRRVYNGMAYCMDTGIANITAALKAKGMWDKTFVVFSSDNGGDEISDKGGNNYPLRGMKFTDFEGGTRVAAFAAGGALPAARRGTVETGLMHVCDWYATFAELAGASPSDSPPDGLPGPDSVSMWDVVAKGAASPRSVIALSKDVLIQWPYKVVLGQQKGKGWWTGKVHPNASYPNITNSDAGCPTGCLFHIDDDPGEHTDLSAALPGVLANLTALLGEYAAGQYQTDSTPGYTNCTTEAAFMAAHHNFQGPICYR